LAAFDFLGGVPQLILYDNTKLAVAKIVKGGKRLRSKMFAELQSHYLFEDRFGRPGLFRPERTTINKVARFALALG